MSRLVTINIEGEVQVHLPGASSDYATMCGLDGDDFDQETVETKRGAKVDCAQCQTIWSECRSFKASSFKAP